MRTRILILTSISLALALPNFFKSDINGKPEYDGKEMYDPSLIRLSNTYELESYVDSIAASRQVRTYSEGYLSILGETIAKRFYAGFSHFSMRENWIAAVSEKALGYGLASKVDPENIMKHPYAGCSQQAIVMMEVLKRKNIHYRVISFPHHYAIEAKISRHWYYFDPQLDPKLSKDQREHTYWRGENDKIKQFYSGIYGNIDYMFGSGKTAGIGMVNSNPAPNASSFQNLTGFLSKALWLLPLLPLFIPRKKKTFELYPVHGFAERPGPAPVYAMKYYF